MNASKNANNVIFYFIFAFRFDIQNLTSINDTQLGSSDSVSDAIAKKRTLFVLGTWKHLSAHILYVYLHVL